MAALELILRSLNSNFDNYCMELNFTKLMERRSRWFFGGIGASISVFFTHPLDLMKVLMQTHEGPKISGAVLLKEVVSDGGAIALYRGLTASLSRQMTYSMTRFGIYDVGGSYIDTSTFKNKIGLTSVAGWIGGIVGSPADIINVRMQNDVKLSPGLRRNYKNVTDGLYRVYTEEGFHKLFTGSLMAASRGVLMTVGQIAFYEEIKTRLLKTTHFQDNLKTHFTGALAAGIIATCLTHPLDVVKTRYMNAKPGEYRGYLPVIIYTAKGGPLAFYKGFIPAFARVGPGTILTFIFIEQLRLYVGQLPETPKNQ